MPHYNTDEDKWVANIVGKVIWPVPSPDLHDRIMMRVQGSAIPNMTSFSIVRLSPFMLAAFVLAFFLGLSNMSNVSSAYKEYNNSYYYSGAGSYMASVMGGQS